MKKKILLSIMLWGSMAATGMSQSPAPSASQTKVPPNPTASPAPDLSPAHKYFTDVELINQNGEKLRFYSDLIKGKVVVISSFMATCQAACPPKNRNLEKIQEAAGDRLGKDVLILSITVDPVTDTAERLKDYAKRYHAKPGWHFLTGKKENVDWALYKIGQYTEDKQDHVNIIVMGNEGTGLWKKAFALSAPPDLIKVFESVLNDHPAKTN
jgi:protein SCO1/2